MKQWFKALDPFWQRTLGALAVALFLVAINGLAGLLD